MIDRFQLHDHLVSRAPAAKTDPLAERAISVFIQPIRVSFLQTVFAIFSPTLVILIVLFTVTEHDVLLSH